MTKKQKNMHAYALSQLRRGITERKTKKKAAACRRNGKLGGRPRKKK